MLAQHAKHFQNQTSYVKREIIHYVAYELRIKAIGAIEKGMTSGSKQYVQLYQHAADGL